MTGAAAVAVVAIDPTSDTTTFCPSHARSHPRAEQNKNKQKKKNKTKKIKQHTIF